MKRFKYSLYFPVVITMIVQKSFIGKLKEFGLNSYEAKLWTALLSRGVSTAGELSDIANVPRSRSYDILESLEKKGFIIMKLGKPIKYLAVHPDEVLERVKKNVKEDADKHVLMLDELKSEDVLGELNLLHSQGVDFINASDLVGCIKGRKNIVNHVETMVKTAQKSITILTSAQGLARKRDALHKHLKKAKERGVKVRIAAPLPKNDKLIKELREVADVYNVNKIKSRFCIIDGKEVLFMLMNDEDVHSSYDAGVWVTTPYFAEALEHMFVSQVKE